MPSSAFEMTCPRCGAKITIRNGVADCPACDYRAKVVNLPGEVERCIEEQRRCRAYLDEHGFTAPPGEKAIDGGTAGAWAGLCDWTMEEAILRAAIQ